jgi:hypothetical protein
MHPARFVLTPLMIVTAEMQNAMDQEHRQLLVQRSLALFGLTDCGWHGNYHIAQHLRRAACGVRRAGFSHGKGQYVGRAILAPIPTIETPHPPIAHEQEAHLRRRFPDLGKNRLRRSFQACSVKRETSDLTLHMDRH